MSAADLLALRQLLRLSQAEFGQLFGVHAMTVSKWERGVLSPSAYQLALMLQFKANAEARAEAERKELKNLLVGAGVVAALVWLFTSR